jgi:hypothetical protein
MIKINLLPGEQGSGRPQAARKSSGPSPAPFYLLLALLYLAAAAAGYVVYTMGSEAARQVSEATAKRDKLKKEVASKQAAFEEQNLRSQEIEEKYAVIEALGPQNRIFWSEKVNMIAMARLHLAVYVTKIELEEKIDERETPESIKRREEWKAAKEKNPKLTTPEPQPVKQPVINQTLVIQALAYGNDSSQRLAQIRNFYENLNALEWTRQSGVKAKFTDRMAPEFEQLPQKTDRVAGVDVLRFGFRIKADPQLDRASDEVEDDKVDTTKPTDPNAPSIAKRRSQEAEALK